MGIGAPDRVTYRRLTPLFAFAISREDTVIHRAGFSNQADSLAFRLWDKSDNFAHIRSNTAWL
jgi:hypothetical protein